MCLRFKSDESIFGEIIVKYAVLHRIGILQVGKLAQSSCEKARSGKFPLLVPASPSIAQIIPHTITIVLLNLELC